MASSQAGALQHEELVAAVELLSKLSENDGPVTTGHAAAESIVRQLVEVVPGGRTLFHTRSLTWRDRAVFVAVDNEGCSFLLQVGGEPAQQGLAAPRFSRKLGSVSAYLYAFGPADDANLLAFAERIDPAFLPRPQRAQPAIAAGNRHPLISLPAVFRAFHDILHETGRNVASTVQLSASREMSTDEAIAARTGDNPTAPGHTGISIRRLFFAGLWTAIRAGYRSGYSAEADHLIVSGAGEREIAQSVERVEEAITQAARYTKFTTDTSRLFDLRADRRHPRPWSNAEIEELFEKHLDASERAWVLNEFVKPFECGERVYRLDPDEIKRQAVKFVPSLKLNEHLFDVISRVKGGDPFDFEPSLDEAETLTTPEELIFCMHWLRERGRRAQLVPPNLGFKKRQAYPESREALARYAEHKMWPELLPRVDSCYSGMPLNELRERIHELAEVARFFDGTLSIHSGSGKQPDVLQSIGWATDGRLNYKISGELQLQLFDVLSEQPERSEGRLLFERMVAACERFAAEGAFGDESELAAFYRAAGRGSSLGNALRGRVDGNLFLVFWLGNLVGSKDEDGCSFKQKLDSLPSAIVDEVRRRNTAYIKWLASNLFG